MHAVTYRTALFGLDLSTGALRACAATLDVAERARAAGYRFRRERDRFVARRGLMRQHLAAQLGTTAAALRLTVDAHGKPYLPDAPALHFNLSHAAGRALLVTAEQPVGCDLAQRDPALACPRIAARLFAAEEVAALAKLSATQWVDGFYDCWTRKEAYVKALGIGLSLPLDAFAVTVAPGEPAQVLRGRAGLTLSSFEPVPGFQAAVALAT